jgi:predicted nucleic acid-binding protein
VKALLDTNVVLDFLLARVPFESDAARLWLACAEGRYEGFISAITPVNVFYIARKLGGVDKAHEYVAQLMSLFHVAPIQDSTIQSALSSTLKDFEDAVQVASALEVGADVIVTRDPKDMATSAVRVISPREFVAELLF